MRRALPAAAALGLLLLPATGHATMVLALSLQELVGRADRIVVARCLDQLGIDTVLIRRWATSRTSNHPLINRVIV